MSEGRDDTVCLKLIRIISDKVAVTRKHLLTMQQLLDYPILLHTIPEAVLVGL